MPVYIKYKLFGFYEYILLTEFDHELLYSTLQYILLICICFGVCILYSDFQ